MLVHPAIAESDRAALGAATSCPATDDGSAVAAVVSPDLLQRFAEVSDGRRDRGRVHPVAVVLALCAALAAATHESSLVLGQVEAATASPPAPVTADSEPMRVAVAAPNGASEPH